MNPLSASWSIRPRRRATAFRCAALAVLLWRSAVAMAPAAELPREADLKAALLYNFTQFVEWPPESFSTPESPVVIGILGRDPFGTGLDKLVGPEQVGQRRIVVERYRNARAAAGCHLLFISGSEKDSLQQILAVLEGRPILTVADFGGFLRRGGGIYLYRNREDKIRVRLNLPVARAAALTISAKLLRVVEIVSEDEE